LKPFLKQNILFAALGNVEFIYSLPSGLSEKISVLGKYL
jgi:hypothetical protein